MLASLDVFEDVPAYYTRLKEAIVVNEIISEDDRIKVSTLMKVLKFQRYIFITFLAEI